MYTEEELKDKKPRELFEIVLELQHTIEAFQSNQLSEDLIVEIIKIVMDDQIRPLKKAKMILEISGYL